MYHAVNPKGRERDKRALGRIEPTGGMGHIW